MPVAFFCRLAVGPPSSKVEASVARCLRTPPDAAKTSGLQVGLSNRLRGLSNRSNVVVGNYCCGPITAEPCRAKARPLHPRRSYFAPAQAQAILGLGGGAGYRPR